MREHPFAHCKYVKTQQVWKIYWKRARGKWELYAPNSAVSNIESFINIVESDVHGCFFLVRNRIVEPHGLDYPSCAMTINKLQMPRYDYFYE